MYLLYNYKESTSIIISVNEEDEVSINTVANIIAKTYNYEHMIEFDHSYSDGQYKKTADNTKLMSILNNDFTFTDIKTGIIKSITWFINNYNNCRK